MSETEKQETTKKGSKKKVIIIVTIVAIALIIMAIVGGMIGYHATQKVALAQEVDTIVKNKDLLTDEINTQDIKTTGDYGKVEKAIKTYLSDFAQSVKKLNQFSDEDKYSNILSAKNYQEDGPDFVETTKLIEETKQGAKDITEEVVNMIKEDSMKEYIKKENVSEKYQQLFIDLMLDDETRNDLEKMKTEMEKQMDTFDKVLTQAQKIIDFLKEEKGNWQVQGSNIVFQSQSVLTQYNLLVSSLSAL